MHDGRLMRYHKAGSRTLAMLMHPAVPLRSDGALALCQDCQRRAWFAGGYLEMLAKDLEGLARIADRALRYLVPALRSLKVGEARQIRTPARERVVDRAKAVADELGWTILIHRGAAGLLRITRLARDTDRSPKGQDSEAGLTRSARAGAEGIAETLSPPQTEGTEL